MDDNYTMNLYNTPNSKKISINIRAENVNISANAKKIFENEIYILYYDSINFSFYFYKKDENLTISVNPNELCYDIEIKKEMLHDVLNPPVLLFARLNGFSIIHGCVLKKNEHTILIIGKSGMGKSTISASLCEFRNFKCISDDIAIVNNSGYVNSGDSKIKLNSDSINFIYNTNIKTSHKKFNVYYESKFSKNVFKIDYIIFVEASDIFNLVELQPKEAFIKLCQNIKLKETMVNRLLKCEYKNLFKLSKIAKCYQLYNVHDYSQLNNTLNKIDNLINGK